MDDDIRGKGRQPWEGYDEYCDRVDREVREDGEVRYPLGFTLYILIIIAVIGYLLWRLVH